MKTFADIKIQINETLHRDIRSILEHQDGRSFRGAGLAPNDFGRAGHDDPHHLSGRGQLLDVLIRKISQLGVENDEFAREVGERLGLELGEGGGVQKLLKLLKCHALGLTMGDLPSDDEREEVLGVVSQIAAHDLAAMEERPLSPEGKELVRAPSEARRPPAQATALQGDPLGYVNQGNLTLDVPDEDAADDELDMTERFRQAEKQFFGEQAFARFVRHKTPDHIKLFSGRVEAYTREDGLWTDYEKVQSPTTYNVEVWWNAGPALFEHQLEMTRIDVHVKSPRYDAAQTGLIYTDSAFAKNLGRLAESKGFGGRLRYTEQGMQGGDWVSLEADESFNRELQKRFPELVSRLAAVRESLELQEDKTDRELKLGLGEFIKDVRAARKRGKNRAAAILRRVVMQVVAQKSLDAQRIAAMLDEGIDALQEVRLSLGEDITPILRDIVARKTAKQVKFDDGKRQTVDLFSASAMIVVHDALNKPHQEKFRRMASKNSVEFNKMLSFSFKHTSSKFRSTGAIRVV